MKTPHSPYWLVMLRRLAARLRSRNRVWLWMNEDGSVEVL